MMPRTAVIVFTLVCGMALHAGESVACGCSKSGVKSRILDGTTVPASQFPTVGEVGDSREFFCTGTLIAPNVVLCAAHCTADDNGNQTLADTQGRFRLGNVVYKTKKVIVHPTYKGFVGDVDGQFDLSILILDTDVPNVTPTPLYRKVPTTGTQLVLAGFGEQGTGSNGGNGTYPTGGNIVTGNTNLEIVTSTFLKWNFGTGESDTAPGDSGGPAFIVEGGVRYLAGVTSGGTGSGFGNDSYDVRVDVQASWIDSVIASQGGTSTGLLISGPSASKNPVAPESQVTFTAVGKDSTVSLSWNFGDGSAAADGASVSHAYGAEGNFTVTLTATSGTETQTFTLAMVVSLEAPPTAGGNDIQPAGVMKKRFTVNFLAPERSKFDISIQSNAFLHADKFDFEEKRFETRVRVFIGGERCDTVEILGTNSVGRFGDGRLSWNYKKGVIRYQLKGDAASEFLVDAGVPDAETQQTLPILFTLQVDGVHHGGNYSFTYKAREGVSGTGK